MTGKPRMPDDRDARFERALKQALIASAAPMPADLKSELKRLARARVPRPSPWGLLRESLTVHPWAYGTGAAFAAAGFLAVMRLGSMPVPGPAPVPVAAVVPQPPPPLADLWTDDDGGDSDEG